MEYYKEFLALYSFWSSSVTRPPKLGQNVINNKTTTPILTITIPMIFNIFFIISIYSLPPTIELNIHEFYVTFNITPKLNFRSRGGMNMYSIGEISKMFQLPISTLRYYDKEGLFPHLKRVNGVRQFSESEIETLRVIDCLKRSGLEIKDIKEYMALCSLGNTTLKQRKAIFEKQKEEVLQEMEKLQKVLSMLNYKCWYYDQAIEKNDEAYVQALSFNQLPPQIQQYYKHSHEDC